MKKQFLLIMITSLYSHFMAAQVLFNENFDSYTLGNLGTDPTGVTPGQGGWLTEIQFFKGTKNNNFTNITNETGMGKVLTISSPMPIEAFNMFIKKTGVNNMVDQRTTGNNIIKLELDFFTGSQHNGLQGGEFHTISLAYGGNNAMTNNTLIEYRFVPKTGRATISYYDGVKSIYDLRLDNITGTTPVLPFNTWIKFNVYLDYNNKKVYFETPYFNAVAVGDFLSQSTSSNLIQDFKPSVFSYFFSVPALSGPQQMINKLDNIKITALKNVPPEVLSTNTFLSEKFNRFPNPASDVVNISNSDNMIVNKVDIYDVTGKLINTQKFCNETETQLNVSALNSGTYLLHLKTNEGIAVKKLVKK